MRIRTTRFTLLAVVWIAAPAQAEWVITPQVAGNLAGNVEFRRGGPGLSVGYLGERIGFEVEVQRYQHFFKDEDVALLIPDNCGIVPTGEPCTDANTRAMGFMGSLVVPVHDAAGRWRPYAIAGIGLTHAWVQDPSRRLADNDQDNLTLGLGGGTTVSLNHRIGLRADLRYSRAFVDESQREGGHLEDYGFLRATIGVTFALGR
jgi:opacity protein-like surface antigen